MESSLDIYYTPKAKETLNSIFYFILQNYGQKVADKFLLKAAKTILLIAKQPFMFKASNIDENVRIGLISEQCSLFYLVTENAIHLLFFWDNRQEPSF